MGLLVITPGDGSVWVFGLVYLVNSIAFGFGVVLFCCFGFWVLLVLTVGDCVLVALIYCLNV